MDDEETRQTHDAEANEAPREDGTRQEPSPPQGDRPQARGHAADVRAAQRLYANARRVFQSHAADLLEGARASLRPFRSLPLPFSPFEVMDATTLERAYQSTLVWLLDPSGRHGFGDRFLRRFLALVGINEFHDIVGLSTTLRPAIAAEVQWSTDTHNSQPGQGLWSKGGRKRMRRIRCDLVLALPPRLYAIELKVKSDERRYELDGSEITQAALYERSLALLCAPRRSDAGWVYSQTPGFDEAQRGLILNALHAHPPAFRASVNACTTVQGVLVHLDSQCSLGAQPAVRPPHRQWRRPIRHLDWRDIAAMLADLRHQQTVDGSSAAVLDGLRQAIYRTVETDELQDLLTSAETLRILCDQPQLLRQWPQETRRLIGVIMGALADRPECTRMPSL